jgi:hypothetical protein
MRPSRTLPRFENLLIEEKTVALPYDDATSFAVNAAKPRLERMGNLGRQWRLITPEGDTNG